MPNTNKNVDVGRPKVGGYAHHAPLGTPLPEDATTALDQAFKNLGYVSKDGVELTDDRSTTKHEDWGGTVIETTTDSFGSTITATFIESLRGDMLKAIYGADNVTIQAPGGGQEGLVTINHNAADPEHGSWVFSMASRKSKKRIVVSDGMVASIGSVKFQTAELISYSVTIDCYPDSNGITIKEYRTLPKTD